MDTTDPYLNPGTGILFNLVGARTQPELDAIEGRLTYARMVQLEQRPVRVTNDVDELRAIHRHLFQDVYAWAGELRVVDLRKNHTGASPFMPVSRLAFAAAYVGEDLEQDRLLQQLGKHDFVERLTHHYDQVNHLHPFREGNGRTQRVFWSRVAHDAGWDLDWTRVTGEVNDEACRVADERGDYAPMRRMLEQITTSVVDRSDGPEVGDVDEPSRRGPRVGTRWQRHRDQHPTEPGYRPAPETPPGRSRGDEERGIE